LETNPIHIDQLGRRVAISYPPRRIVSLVPSQTELLYHLGASVVGITKFCVHPPEWLKGKTRIGGTKQLHIDEIRALHPDLIIANKEENSAEQVLMLMQEFPVWVSDIHCLKDALHMIRCLGVITGFSGKADQMVIDILKEFRALPVLAPVKTAYFIWKDPWMVAGGDTFIHQMMKACSLENVFADSLRYPAVTFDQLNDCQLILLSSEPYPFKDKHIAELQAILPAARIQLVDGEMFSWYGSRLLLAPAYFREFIKVL
jgi:ABC-type Fe3+-hydroxamate transport system substrate-binding protein